MNIYQAINEFERWRSVKNASSKKEFEFLRQFALYMRNCDLFLIEESDVTDYTTMMLDMGWQINGMASRLSAVRQFFKYCDMKGYDTLSHKLVQVPKKEKTMPYTATDEDCDVLIETLKTHGNRYKKARDLALVSLLKDTGARCSEILNLNVSDLDLEGMEAIIRTLKSRGQKPFRQVYWTDKTHHYILDWLEMRDQFYEMRFDLIDGGALFISTKGGNATKKAGERLNVAGLGQMLRIESRRANLPNTINAHSFRHRMGHLLNERGANNSVISSILGHSNLESSYIYTELNNRERSEAYRSLIDRGDGVLYNENIKRKNNNDNEQARQKIKYRSKRGG